MKNHIQYLKTKVLWLVILAIVPILSKAQNQQLSLQEAIEKARVYNRDLRIDSLNIAKSARETAITKGLLLPSISATGQFQRYFQRPVFFGLNSTSNSEGISYSRFGGQEITGAQVTLAQPLYNAGAKHEIQRRRLLEKQSRLFHQEREVDVVARVRQNYVQLLVLNERLKLQKESISRNQKALADSRSLLAQGRALRVDTLRAYTSVRNLEPDVLRLTYALQISQQQLSILIGNSPETQYNLTDSLRFNAADSLPTESGTFRTSLVHRPDFQILNLNKDINDKQIELYKSARLPVVSFVSQYQIQTQTNGLRYDQAGYPPVFYAGIQFAIPLFSGMQHVNKIAMGKIERQQSDLIYENAQEQLKTEVKQVLASLYETSQRIKTQQNVSETAELSYSITKYRYEKGVASRLELTDAEFALTTAKSNYLEAVFDYLSAKIELDRTMGKAEN
ncbi:Outer membrane protein OprM [Dyadobacter sp. CECT 9275]|uniref:Outer membrane protein OprM n=1 Tax=Dyadobacter helix TaxID=2822344 RepID=A0A916NMM0_9BACT|nr:TolC family protein [Dyadobacter sp. CECT 9275]CAG5007454.1 Outer membrane protein OprM [Dyadobacter sp. CECT 9275]